MFKHNVGDKPCGARSIPLCSQNGSFCVIQQIGLATNAAGKF